MCEPGLVPFVGVIVLFWRGWVCVEDTPSLNMKCNLNKDEVLVGSVQESLGAVYNFVL